VGKVMGCEGTGSGAVPGVLATADEGTETVAVELTLGAVVLGSEPLADCTSSVQPQNTVSSSRLVRGAKVAILAR
jgi:2-methylcitrate dehydratase PrpD